MTDTELITAIRNLLGTPTAAPAAPASGRPAALTDEIAAALAKRFGWTSHDIFGNRQANGSATDPFVAACDGTPEDAWLYSLAGFDAVGGRVLWAADNREAADSLCAWLNDPARTAAEANDRLRGSGDPGMETDCACYLIRTNHITGGGLAGSPRLGFAGALTVAQAVAATFAQSPRKPGDPGAGIAG